MIAMNRIKMMNKSHWKKMGYYVVLMLLFVAGIAIHSVFTIAGLVLSCAFLLTTDQDGVVELQFALFPFMAVLHLRGSSFSFINVFLLLGCLRVVWLNRFKISRRVGFGLLVIMLLNLTSIITQGLGIIKDLITLDFELLLLFLVLDRKHDWNLEHISRILAVALVISAMASMVSQYFPMLHNAIRQVVYKEQETGVRYARLSGLMGNPNYYTLAINLCLATQLVVMLPRKKAKWYDLCLSAGIMVSGVMSLSSSFALALVLTFVLIMVYLLSTKPTRFVKYLVIFAMLGGLVVLFAGEEYIGVLLGRLLPQGGMASISVDEYTSGRFTRYALFLKHIWNNPHVLFIGDGFGLLVEKHAAHNFVLEWVSFFGIIGTGAVALWLYSSESRFKGNGILRWLPLIIMLFRGMAINILVAITFPYYVMIVLFALRENTAAGNRASLR